MESRRSGGRPSVMILQEDERTFDGARHRPMASAIQLSHDIQLPCHPLTTGRRLHENNKVHPFLQADKARLTPANREAREGFALQHIVFDAEYWKTNSHG